MPTYESGQMWDAYHDSDLMLVTANATIRRDGALVMGRGAALEAKQMFPGIDHAYGGLISAMDTNTYGLLTPTMLAFWHVGTGRRMPHIEKPLFAGQFRIGLFQVKHHFSESASLALIDRSVADLISHLEFHPEITRVDMNYPGVGNGRLNKELVEPRLRALPHYVHIWSKD